MQTGGSIIHIKQFEAEYTYDYDLDVANIEVKTIILMKNPLT